MRANSDHAPAHMCVLSDRDRESGQQHTLRKLRHSSTHENLLNPPVPGSRSRFLAAHAFTAKLPCMLNMGYCSNPRSDSHTESCHIHPRGHT